MSPSRRQAVTELSLALGGALLLFAAALALCGALELLAGRAVSGANALVALLASAAFLWRSAAPLGARARAAVVLAFAASVLLAGLVEAAFFDLSWDGQDYHQQAIANLAGGWNPLTAPREPADFYRNVWLNHYPKASWTAAASLLLATGSMEAAKACNLLLAAAAFLTALGALLQEERLRARHAAALAALIALNPVVTCQLFTHYVDGMAASALTAMGASFLAALRRPRLAPLVSLGAATALALNLKFTCTVYAGIAAVCFGLFCLLRRQRRALAALALGVALGVLVLGYHPYVTSLVRYGNPLYPTAAAGSRFGTRFVLQSQAPASFLERSRAAKFALSLLARSANDFTVSEVALKFPLQVAPAELRAFKDPDVRFGGFGPLFGAAFLLSCGVWIAAARGQPGAALLALLALATALANPEPWWSRYSPQLWLPPLLAVFAAQVSPSPRLRKAGALVALLAALDAAAVLGVSLAANARESSRVRRTLLSLERGAAEVPVYVGPLQGAARLLKDHGIRFRLVERPEDLPCRAPLTPGTLYSPAGCSPPPEANRGSQP